MHVDAIRLSHSVMPIHGSNTDDISLYARVAFGEHALRYVRAMNHDKRL